jgi:hypothetical protein
VPTSAPRPQQDFTAEARSLLRQWSTLSPDSVLDAVGRLGAREIAMAAEASARLDRGVDASRSAQRSLATLEALAASLAPPEKRARTFFARADPQEDDLQPRIQALVDSLDRERDAVALSLMALKRDLAKLGVAATMLEDALQLIRACVKAAEAAGRELAVERPDRAQLLCEGVRLRLVEREQDVLTQAAVTNQGMLTLQLLLDGQQALAHALESARSTSVSALRTAIAARRALAGSQDLARQANALGGAARDAAERTEALAGLQRAVDQALDEARRAIDTPRPPADGTRP